MGLDGKEPFSQQDKKMDLMIVDSNNLAYRAYFTTGVLSNGIVFGFLKQILYLAKTLKSNKFIFCWDSKSSYRREVDPEYKGNRKPLDPNDQTAIDLQEARKQFALLRKEVLPSLGFKNNFVQRGYEADDLIAHVVNRFPDNYIIVSGDEDLYQLLLKTKLYETKIYQPIKKKFITYGSFAQEYGITADRWAEVKALAGCASDNVKGVIGVGEKTAIKYLNNNLKGKALESINNSKEIISQSRYLVTLPFPGDRPIYIKGIEYEELMIGDFMDTFTRFGMKSFTYDDSFEEWEEAFKLLAF